MFLGLGSAAVGSVFLAFLTGHPGGGAFARPVLPLSLLMLGIAVLTRFLRPRRD
jgi:hypothetical protein